MCRKRNSARDAPGMARYAPQRQARNGGRANANAISREAPGAHAGRYSLHDTRLPRTKCRHELLDRRRLRLSSTPLLFDPDLRRHMHKAVQVDQVALLPSPQKSVRAERADRVYQLLLRLGLGSIDRGIAFGSICDMSESRSAAVSSVLRIEDF